MKKTFISILCAIFCFFSCSITSFASSSMPDADLFEGEELACYLLFKGILTRHDTLVFEGQYWNGASSNRILKEQYWLGNDTSTRVNKRVNIDSGDVYKISVMCSGTYPNLPDVTFSASNVDGVTIDTQVINLSSTSFQVTATIKSTKNSVDPYFIVYVNGNSWMYPLSLSSENTDIDTIIDLLTSINTGITTTNSRLSTTNSRLLNIYNILNNNNSSLQDNFNDTNNTLNNQVNGLESIESTYMSGLSDNAPTRWSVNSSHWLIGSSTSASTFSFIADSLTNIYNANSTLKTFTDTILLLGFAFVIVGVIL